MQGARQGVERFKRAFLERHDMKKTRLAGVFAISLLALAGCIHVTDDHYDRQDEIVANTETALRVCGGAGEVQEVTDNGYSCKASAD